MYLPSVLGSLKPFYQVSFSPPHPSVSNITATALVFIILVSRANVPTIFYCNRLLIIIWLCGGKNYNKVSAFNTLIVDVLKYQHTIKYLFSSNLPKYSLKITIKHQFISIQTQAHSWRQRSTQLGELRKPLSSDLKTTLRSKNCSFSCLDSI